MKNLETGIKLPRDKGPICYGDMLKSSVTHGVVVMHHKIHDKPIVKIIGEDIWFPLEDFVNSWAPNLEIDGNINVYD